IRTELKENDKTEAEKKDTAKKDEKPAFAETRVPRIIDGQKEALAKAVEMALAAEKNLELAKKQSRGEVDTKDTANFLKPLAKDAAQTLEKAEQAMKESKDALAKNNAKKAEMPQEKASHELKEARKEIDKLIAAAEKEKNDPLAALKKAAE